MENSSIEWTDHTFNPWLGCTKVSAGCTHCYAERMMDTRFGRAEWGPAGTRVVTSLAYWEMVWAWNREARAAGRPARVFCASLSDVFEVFVGSVVDRRGDLLLDVHDMRLTRRSPASRDESQDNSPAPRASGSGLSTLDSRPPSDRATLADVRRALWHLIDQTPDLIWLLLTKHPENIFEMVPRRWLDEWPEHVVPGTSIEDQRTADARLPHLLDVPAPRRFVSVEPQLAAIDLSEWLGVADPWRISWVIQGGESGPGARPFDLAWARSLREQCRAAHVPYFLKQLGAWPVETAERGDPPVRACWPIRVAHGRGGDESEWPEDLRGCREVPEFESRVGNSEESRVESREPETDARRRLRLALDSGLSTLDSPPESRARQEKV